MNVMTTYIDGLMSDAERRMPRSSWFDDFDAVIRGEPCDFWPANGWRSATDSPKWDNEQHVALFVAVQRACALPCASAEQRWQYVERVLREQAALYADVRSDERGDDPREVAEEREAAKRA